MKALIWFLLLPLVWAFSGCAAYRTAGEVQQGRYALLAGRSDSALAYFRSAADRDPDFIYNFSPLRQSVWTYLGRAYYDLGNLPEAEKALHRGYGEHASDHLARLYLGLVYAREGRFTAALSQMAASLKSLHDWLDWLEYYTVDGHYWDPGRRLRKELQADLDLISGKDIDWPKLIHSVEWLGKEFEEEIDRARYDKSRQRRQRDRFHGLLR